MTYTITCGVEIAAASDSARTAREAVEKAERFESQGFKGNVTNSDGEIVTPHSLKLAIDGIRFT